MSKHPHSRAHRRFHRNRVIQNRRQSISWLQSLERDVTLGRTWLADPQKAQAWLDRALGKAHKTPTPCSCASCGNPRRKKNFPGGFDSHLTRGEILAQRALEEGVQAWWENN